MSVLEPVGIPIELLEVERFQADFAAIEQKVNSLKSAAIGLTPDFTQFDQELKNQQRSFDVLVGANTENLEAELSEVLGKNYEVGVKIGLSAQEFSLPEITQEDLILRVKVEVDDSRLFDLNDHTQSKIDHIKELNNTPVEIKGGVGDLGIQDALAQIAALEVRALRIKTGSLMGGVSPQKPPERPQFDSQELSEPISEAIKEGFEAADKGNIFKSIAGSLVSAVTAPIRGILAIGGAIGGNVLRGATEGIGKRLTKGLGKGIAGAVERELASLFGSSEFFGDRVTTILAQFSKKLAKDTTGKIADVAKDLDAAFAGFASEPELIGEKLKAISDKLKIDAEVIKKVPSPLAFIAEGYNDLLDSVSSVSPEQFEAQIKGIAEKIKIDPAQFEGLPNPIQGLLNTYNEIVAEISSTETIRETVDFAPKFLKLRDALLSDAQDAILGFQDSFQAAFPTEDVIIEAGFQRSRPAARRENITGAAKDQLLKEQQSALRNVKERRAQLSRQLSAVDGRIAELQEEAQAIATERDASLGAIAQAKTNPEIRTEVLNEVIDQTKIFAQASVKEVVSERNKLQSKLDELKDSLAAAPIDQQANIGSQIGSISQSIKTVNDAIDKVARQTLKESNRLEALKQDPNADISKESNLLKKIIEQNSAASLQNFDQLIAQRESLTEELENLAKEPGKIREKFERVSTTGIRRPRLFAIKKGFDQEITGIEAKIKSLNENLSGLDGAQDAILESLKDRESSLTKELAAANAAFESVLASGGNNQSIDAIVSKIGTLEEAIAKTQAEFFNRESQVSDPEAVSLKKAPIEFNIQELERKKAGLVKQRQKVETELLQTPQATPEVFKEILADLGQSALPDESIPKMIVDDIGLMAKNAHSLFDTFSNTVTVTSDMAEAIHRNALSVEQLTILAEELAHATQTDFGSTRGIETAISNPNRFKGANSLPDAEPTQQDLNELAPVLGFYREATRQIELEAKVQAKRTANAIADNQKAQKDREKLLKSAGFAGANIKKQAPQLDKFRETIEVMKQRAEQLGVDFSAEVGDLEDSLTGLSKTMEMSLERLSKVSVSSSGSEEIKQAQQSTVEFIQDFAKTKEKIKSQVTALETRGQQQQQQASAELAKQTQDINVSLTPVNNVQSGLQKLSDTLEPATNIVSSGLDMVGGGLQTLAKASFKMADTLELAAFSMVPGAALVRQPLKAGIRAAAPAVGATAIAASVPGGAEVFGAAQGVAAGGLSMLTGGMTEALTAAVTGQLSGVVPAITGAILETSVPGAGVVANVAAEVLTPIVNGVATTATSAIDLISGGATQAIATGATAVGAGKLLQVGGSTAAKAAPELATNAASGLLNAGEAVTRATAKQLTAATEQLIEFIPKERKEQLVPVMRAAQEYSRTASIFTKNVAVDSFQEGSRQVKALTMAAAPVVGPIVKDTVEKTKIAGEIIVQKGLSEVQDTLQKGVAAFNIARGKQVDTVSGAKTFTGQSASLPEPKKSLKGADRDFLAIAPKVTGDFTPIAQGFDQIQKLQKDVISDLKKTSRKFSRQSDPLSKGKAAIDVLGQASAGKGIVKEQIAFGRKFGQIGSTEQNKLTGGLSAFSREQKKAKNFLQKMARDFRKSGHDIGFFIQQGLAQGLSSADATKQAESMVRDVIDIAERDFGIQSPSRVFKAIGRFISQGLGLGIGDDSSPVEAIKAQVDKVTGKAKDTLFKTGVRKPQETPFDFNQPDIEPSATGPSDRIFDAMSRERMETLEIEATAARKLANKKNEVALGLDKYDAAIDKAAKQIKDTELRAGAASGEDKRIIDQGKQRQRAEAELGKAKGNDLGQFLTRVDGGISDDERNQIKEIRMERERINEEAAKAAQGPPTPPINKEGLKVAKKELGLIGKLLGNVKQIAITAFTGFVGFQAFDLLKRQLRESLDIFKQFQGLKIGINLSQGGIEQGASAFDFIKKKSDEFGLSVLTSAENYKFLGTQVRGTALQSDLNQVFEGLATVSTALQFTEDKAQRLGLAFGQIISKGKFSAEETRQQLSELGIPITLIAKGLGFAENEMDKFNKQLETGKILSTRENVLGVVEALRSSFAPGVAEASQSLRAIENRFQNASNAAREEFAKSAMPTVTSSLNVVTSGLKFLSENMAGITIALKIAGTLGAAFLANQLLSLNAKMRLTQRGGLLLARVFGITAKGAFGKAWREADLLSTKKEVLIKKTKILGGATLRMAGQMAFAVAKAGLLALGISSAFSAFGAFTAKSQAARDALKGFSEESRGLRKSLDDSLDLDLAKKFTPEKLTDKVASIATNKDTSQVQKNLQKTGVSLGFLANATEKSRKKIVELIAAGKGLGEELPAIETAIDALLGKLEGGEVDVKNKVNFETVFNSAPADNLALDLSKENLERAAAATSGLEAEALQRVAERTTKKGTADQFFRDALEGEFFKDLKIEFEIKDAVSQSTRIKDQIIGDIEAIQKEIDEAGGFENLDIQKQADTEASVSKNIKDLNEAEKEFEKIGGSALKPLLEATIALDNLGIVSDKSKEKALELSNALANLKEFDRKYEVDVATSDLEIAQARERGLVNEFESGQNAIKAQNTLLEMRRVELEKSVVAGRELLRSTEFSRKDPTAQIQEQDEQAKREVEFASLQKQISDNNTQVRVANSQRVQSELDREFDVLTKVFEIEKARSERKFSSQELNLELNIGDRIQDFTNSLVDAPLNLRAQVVFDNEFEQRNLALKDEEDRFNIEQAKRQDTINKLLMERNRIASQFTKQADIAQDIPKSDESEFRAAQDKLRDLELQFINVDNSIAQAEKESITSSVQFRKDQIEKVIALEKDKINRLVEVEKSSLDAINSAQKRRIESSVAGLEKVKAENDSLTKSLDRQKATLESFKSVFDALNSAKSAALDGRIAELDEVNTILEKLQSEDGPVDARSFKELKRQFKEISGISTNLSSPRLQKKLLLERQKIEDEIARNKFDSLKRELSQAQMLLDIDLKRQRIAAKSAVSDAQIGQRQAEISLIDSSSQRQIAQLDLFAAQETGTSLDISKAQIQLENAIAQEIISREKLGLSGVALADSLKSLAEIDVLAENTRQVTAIDNQTKLQSFQREEQARERGQSRDLLEKGVRPAKNRTAIDFGEFESIGKTTFKKVFKSLEKMGDRLVERFNGIKPSQPSAIGDVAPEIKKLGGVKGSAGLPEAEFMDLAKRFAPVAESLGINPMAPVVDLSEKVSLGDEIVLDQTASENMNLSEGIISELKELKQVLKNKDLSVHVKAKGAQVDVSAFDDGDDELDMMGR